MRSRKPGSRYPLLLYQRVMNRLWAPTLVLGLLLLLVWGWELYFNTPLVQAQSSIWTAAAGCVSLAFSLFAFLGRKVAYVQPFGDHLRLVTPFLRLNISYRRIRNSHPVIFQQLFPPKDASWSQRNLLAPFYGKTAVVVELTQYPMHPRLLRFFLAPQMFSPHTTGLVFLVPDWMAFSTELDSFWGSWRQTTESKPPQKTWKAKK